MKKSFLTMLVMVLCAIGLMVHAQEKTFADSWAASQTKQYVEDLDLSEKQAAEVHGVLLTTAKKAEEIKNTQTGETQTRALWHNNRGRLDKLNTIFTREQREKLKAAQTTEKKESTPKTVPLSKTEKSDEAKKWATNRMSYYTKNLDLSAKQAQEVYDILLRSAVKSEEIKQSREGKAQQNAVWHNNKDRDDRLISVLNQKQQQKFKDLQLKEQEAWREKQAK